jgi:hypothetical protein
MVIALGKRYVAFVSTRIIVEQVTEWEALFPVVVPRMGFEP